MLLDCQVHGGRAPHELASARSWFKLFFFLPLFPVGRERHLLTCSQCGASQEVSEMEAQQLASGAEPGFQEAFGRPSEFAEEPPMRVASRRLDRDS